MLKSVLAGMLVMALVLGLAGRAVAAPPHEVVLDTADDTLNGGDDLGDENAPGGVVSEAGAGGDGSRAKPWLYQFTSGGLNVGSYKVYTDNGDSFKLDLGGHDLDGTSGGVSLSTYRYSFYATPSGDVLIENVGEVSIGGVVTQTKSTDHEASSGSFRVGTSAAGATGDIRIDYVHTNRLGSAGGPGGNVSIYGEGDVRIATSGGVPGLVDTRSPDRANSGLVCVEHDGSFAAGTIDAHNNSYTRSGGSLQFDGDVLGDGPSGSFEAANLYTYQNRGTYGDDGGDVSIAGYNTVTVTGDILTYSTSPKQWNTSPVAGNITVSAKHDILVKGEIDANCGRGPSYDGIVSLTTTGSSIVLGDPENPGADVLDLNNARYILFDCASGESMIWHDLDNVVEGTTLLRVANAGDVVYYSRDANPDLLGGGPLGDGVYPLTGGGVNGTLEPEPVPVPEPAGLALFGLALLGLRRRR